MVDIRYNTTPAAAKSYIREKRACRLRALLLLAAAPGAARADTAATEVAALLDFCSANPGMSYGYYLPRYYYSPVCGSGTITVDLGYDDYGDGNHLGYEDRAQWGSGDPCAGDRWLGVTCDAAGEHVTKMCALFYPSPPFGLPAAADPRRCACAETCAMAPGTAAVSRA